MQEMETCDVPRDSRLSTGSRDSSSGNSGWWFGAQFLMCTPHSCSCEHTEGGAQPKSAFLKVTDLYDRLLENSEGVHNESDDSSDDIFAVNGSFMTRWHTEQAQVPMDAAEAAKMHALLNKLVSKISPEMKVTHVDGNEFMIGARSVQISFLPIGASASIASFSHLVGLVGQVPAMEAARVQVVDGPLRQPLMDYLLHTGKNEVYDTRGLENPNEVTHAGRAMTFVCAPKSVRESDPNDKLEAMKTATLQAGIRKRYSEQKV
mmetsp:Transcript_8818/g.15840  ORF Transcript_8818/g.15840 Transcript_8818/m.15840 type:complete len:262 (-) Transcript_8818:59-844(-)